MVKAWKSDVALRLSLETRQPLVKYKLVNIWELNDFRQTGLLRLIQYNVSEDIIIDILNVMFERHPEITEFLLNYCDYEHNHILLHSIIYKRHKVAKKLMERMTMEQMNHSNSYGINVFIASIQTKSEEMAMNILDRGFDIRDRQDIIGNTPLMVALDCKMYKLSNRILDMGIDISQLTHINKLGYTAFTHACMSEFEDIVLRIFDLGVVDIGHVTTNNITVLNIVCNYGFESLAMRILQNDLDIVKPELANTDGFTALMNALHAGMELTAMWLIDTGRANIEQVNKHGDNALMIACNIGLSDLCHRLMDTGLIDLSHQTGNKNTAIILAIDNGLISVAHRIIDSKCGNLEALDEHDENALILSIRYKYFDLVEFILKSGQLSKESICYRNKDGYTSLKYAIENEMLDIVRMLMPYYELSHLKSEDKELLEMAMNTGLPDLMEMILDNMAETEKKRQDEELKASKPKLKKKGKCQIHLTDLSEIRMRTRVVTSIQMDFMASPKPERPNPIPYEIQVPNLVGLTPLDRPIKPEYRIRLQPRTLQLSPLKKKISLKRMVKRILLKVKAFERSARKRIRLNIPIRHRKMGLKPSDAKYQRPVIGTSAFEMECERRHQLRLKLMAEVDPMNPKKEEYEHSLFSFDIGHSLGMMGVPSVYFS